MRDRESGEERLEIHSYIAGHSFDQTTGVLFRGSIMSGVSAAEMVRECRFRIIYNIGEFDARL